MRGIPLEPSKSIGAFPDVPDLETFGEEAYVFFHLAPKHTNYINRIIEGYEYLGVMTSVEGFDRERAKKLLERVQIPETYLSMPNALASLNSSNGLVELSLISAADSTSGTERLAYGGDFEDRPNDYEFSGDGVMFADRTPSPKA